MLSRFPDESLLFADDNELETCFLTVETRNLLDGSLLHSPSFSLYIVLFSVSELLFQECFTLSQQKTMMRQCYRNYKRLYTTLFRTYILFNFQVVVNWPNTQLLSYFLSHKKSSISKENITNSWVKFTF